jgi:hypothetical protein
LDPVALCTVTFTAEVHSRALLLARVDVAHNTLDQYNYYSELRGGVQEQRTSHTSNWT